ncbi:hypothetical protein [Arcobacter roscoffensis]|uniref:Uncharacterized protein n=1 Tax=Arcobacter roscoffensis TaxID=2961520 RepID=A0ABY5E1N5_9BACT|nr:hypothetical protein [Arcobacter roscoffensis]UTJ05382.1 hypothetical protein NJU99_08885 [Arcobacter roscoffensis]
MKTVAAVLKDFQGLLVLLGVSGTIAVNNIQSVVALAQDYSVHILVGLLIIVYVSEKRNKKKIDELKDCLNDSILEAARDNLRANVKQLAKELAGVKVIDKEHSIAYIYKLEERRKKLKVNSFTQDTLRELISRIKVSKE